MTQKIDENSIIEKCEELLEELEIDGVPVNLKMVGSYLGVSDIKELDIDEAGKIIPQLEGGYVVLIRKTDSSGRKRFTTAHELGHIIVPGGIGGVEIVDYEVGEFDKHKKIEFLCDVAAASLLMPKKVFDEFVKGKNFSMQTVMEVSEKFDVSLEAAALQMVKRDISKRAVVVWELTHKPKEEILLATSTFPGFEEFAPEKQLRVKYAFGFSGKEHIPKAKSLDETGGVVESAFSDSERNIHKASQSMCFGDSFIIDCKCEAVLTINGRVLSILNKK